MDPFRHHPIYKEAKYLSNQLPGYLQAEVERKERNFEEGGDDGFTEMRQACLPVDTEKLVSQLLIDNPYDGSVSMTVYHRQMVGKGMKVSGGKASPADIARVLEARTPSGVEDYILELIAKDPKKQPDLSELLEVVKNHFGLPHLRPITDIMHRMIAIQSIKILVPDRGTGTIVRVTTL